MSQLFNNNSYHVRQPNANAWVNFDNCSRPDSKSTYVEYTFSFGVTINNGYYGRSNSTGFQFEIDGAENTGYIVGNGGSNSITFGRNNSSTNGVVGLTIRVWHHQGTNANPYRW